ncbi:Tcoingi protein, partial [Trypanosoma conorhini]
MHPLCLSSGSASTPNPPGGEVPKYIRALAASRDSAAMGRAKSTCARATYPLSGGRLRRARSAVWLHRPLVLAPGTRTCSMNCNGGGSLARGRRAECQDTELGPAELLLCVLKTSGRRVAGVFTASPSLLRSAFGTGPTRVTDGVLRRIWGVIAGPLRRGACACALTLFFGRDGAPHTHNEAADELAKAALEEFQGAPARMADIRTATRRRRAQKTEEGAIVPAGPDRQRRCLVVDGASPQTAPPTRAGELILARCCAGASPHLGGPRRIA